MITILTKEAAHPIYDQIETHPAYFGFVQGLKAEKMVRGQKPYTYVLRAGETAGDYYVTFANKDGSIQHQPFIISITTEGWHCENGNPYGPYTEEVAFAEVLHKVMHCEQDECTPYAVNKITSL